MLTLNWLYGTKTALTYASFILIGAVIAGIV
jgi:hypothetical protein